MARNYVIKKDKIINELYKIIVEYNKQTAKEQKDNTGRVSTKNKLDALAQIAKMKGYNEAEKTESTIKNLDIVLKF